MNRQSRPILIFATVLSTSLLLVGFISPVHAENWSRFRGPNGAGVVADQNFPAKWTDDDYLWKISLPGLGHSSPVGWGDRLFVTSGNPETGAVTLHCISVEDGAEIWQQEFAGQQYQMHASNSYASTTPTVDAQHVYFTWAVGGKVHCVALNHQGKESWRAELGDFAGPHGFAASPVVIDGVVCLQVDYNDRGFLAGIDAKSGDVRWRAERSAGKASYATPCVVSLPAGRSAAISQSMQGGMQAIEVQTGEVVWELPAAFPARCVSSPFLVDNMLIGICGGGGAGKQLISVELSSSKLPTEKMILRKKLPYVPTPVVSDHWLFLWQDRGTVTLVDLSSETPEKTVWTERIGGNFFGSPILAGDKIYCLSMEGMAVVIAATGEFELLGKNDLGEATNATPAVHQGRMYLRTVSSLACLPAE